MIRRLGLLLVGLILLAASAHADPFFRRQADGASGVSADDETDNFGLKGIIVDRSAIRDTDRFERDTTRVGTPIHYASPYEFLAIGASRNEFRQRSWSAAVNSLVVAGRNVNRRTAEGYSARVALTTNTDKPEWHGDVSWNLRLSASTGLEFVGNRDAVDSVDALKQGILHNFVGVSVDHTLGERLTLIAMPTYQTFSDGNERRGWRAAAIYSLLPEYGLSLDLRARAYDSSEHSTAYFNPERYERGEYGLRLRHSIGAWRLFAVAGAGREYIDGDTSKPTRHFTMHARRSFAGDVVVGGEFTYYQASDSASGPGGSDNFAWRKGRIYLSVPF